MGVVSKLMHIAVSKQLRTSGINHPAELRYSDFCPFTTTRLLLCWHLICTVAQHSARNLGNLSRKQPQITVSPNTQRNLTAEHQLLLKGSETKRTGICTAKSDALLYGASGRI